MKTNWTRGLSLIGLLLASTATSQANDIVDFLNAINGNPGHRTAPVAVQSVSAHDHRHGHAGGGIGRENYGAYRRETPYGGAGVRRSPVNSVNLRASQNVAPPARSRVQVNLRFASNGRHDAGYAPLEYIPSQPLPPVPSYPTRHAYRQVAPSPFELGQFIDCRVPLATCVEVVDECRIAPNAVPVIIAVRDPHMCVHDVLERLVYVQIFVPPCRLRDMCISPCRTHISLDYGCHEVDIKSGNGLVVIDYDN